VGAWNETALDSADNVFRAGYEKNEAGLHPAQKPLSLMKQLIEMLTIEGQRSTAGADPNRVADLQPAMLGDWNDSNQAWRQRDRGVLLGAHTVLWNGPIGVFESDLFAAGTEAVGQAIVDSGALSVVGGGDSAAAAHKLGFADKMTFISTGRGATIEYIEGKDLPGVAALRDAKTA